MGYDVRTTEEFEVKAEYYFRKKRYLRIRQDIRKIIEQLKQGILVGDEIPGLKLTINESTYKVRVANTSANIGKSGGFRIIYYVIKDNKVVYLLTIYSNKDQEDISIGGIKALIKRCCMQ